MENEIAKQIIDENRQKYDGQIKDFKAQFEAEKKKSLEIIGKIEAEK